jgi:hypothetical protein
LTGSKIKVVVSIASLGNEVRLSQKKSKKERNLLIADDD